MKYKFRHHLLASTILFLFIAIFLVVFRVNNLQLLFLFLGIILGMFLLDLDHFIFWYFLKPNLEESRLARTALSRHDFKSIFRLIKISHNTHHNLIFHHYFFQIILVLFSFFIFTSTNNLFVHSLTISLNLHLLIDEYIDYFRDPKILQKWLFAREQTQLPVKFLGQYLAVFTVFFVIFVTLLIKFQI